MKRIGFLIGLAAVLAAGCSRTEMSREFDYQTNHTITVYNADGSVRHVYHTQGKCYSENGSDGWFFTDTADHKLTMVTGFVEVKTAE